MSTQAQPASKRRKTAAETLVTNNDTPPELPPIPVFKIGEITLNEDVMVKIYVEMLDPASCCSATALSKAHKAALIPRQTHVWIGGFRSLESFLNMGFVGMQFISFRECRGHAITDVMLQAVADQNRLKRESILPELSSIPPRC